MARFFTGLELLGRCLVQPVSELDYTPELTTLDSHERTEKGYRLEIFMGNDGYKYWKVTGYFTSEYDKFYKVYQEEKDMD